MLIKKIYDQYETLSNTEIIVQGWIKSSRRYRNLVFIIVSDGSNIRNLQIVCHKDNVNDFDAIYDLRTGAAIAVTGILKVTPDKEQPFELQAKVVQIYNNAAEEYPLQKKEHSNEYLREIAHLRARTSTFWAIFTIRNTVSKAIHDFFQNNNFLYLTSPIITSNDAEGAGESFTVTTRDDNQYELDFFGKKASLTVSGQLNAEAYAQAFKQVYTFGPTFRAEMSYTTRHIAEFWMVEPEVAFTTLQDNIALAQNLLKYVIKVVIDENRPIIEFLNNEENNLISRLEQIVNEEFVTITYDQAIKELMQVKEQFDNQNIIWGMDLQTEHERYLCEKLTSKPTFVINYPQEIKAFYMKLNDDQKTVQAMDLLVPGIGELIGGSQREDNYELLLERMQANKLDVDAFQWYLDLRKFGYAPSGGFGLGLERLVMYVTGTTNIRDVIPFPRAPKNLQF